jgi:two-component system chemotaxis response regulator CheY
MGKKKVLLVDDSTTIARQLQGLLEGTGEFEVVGHGRDGLEGIKLYTSLKPDVVLLDLVMPEMDGLQTLRAIMSLDKDARVVVISSAGGVGEKVVEALKFGARNVVSKPFEPERVIEIVRQL